jgi:hypothetical protein
MKISMPPEETKRLKEIIENSKNILEYGSGGSTFYASKCDLEHIITTENDKEFLKMVMEKCQNSIPDIIPVYVYVGETVMWGYPINKKFKDSWKRYPISPWEKAKERGIIPDTVIIDGRFRVASFIYSINNSEPGTIIFWDDYVNRKSYHVVESICKPNEVVGRAAIFIKENQKIDQDLLDKYYEDMR